MNNKGFAITGIVYGILVLFILVIASFLTILVGRSRRMDELFEGVRNNLYYDTVDITLDSNYQFGDNAYQENLDVYNTSKRGKYIFTFPDTSKCIVYLPKNVVIINKPLRETGNEDVSLDNNNSLYYYKVYEGHTNSSEVDDYEKLICKN